MVHSKFNDKWIVYIFVTLLCLVLTSFWMMCNMYARYSSSASGSDGARVALFGHNQSISLNEELDDLVPGKSFKYTLNVANYEGTKVSEVSLRYYFEIVTTGNLPLQYTITDENNNEIGSFDESVENTSQFGNDTMYFDSSSQQKKEYTVNVVWPEDRKDEKYADIPDDIVVNIHVEQMD